MCCVRWRYRWGVFLTVGLVFAVAPKAGAQEANELPEIVIEGSSLAVRPTQKGVRKPSNTQKSDAGADAPQQDNPQSAPANETEGSGEGLVEGETSAQSDAVVTPGDLVSNQGTSVSVVTGQDLRRQNIRTTADALRSLPGVSVSRTGSNAGLTQVRIRGAEGNHTLVLVDGIEANQAGDGEFDFANLGVEEIEQIEVLRGPQSGLYGSGAIGGVINIRTRSGKGPLTFTARGEAGSFRTKDGTVSVSAGNEDVHGLISLHKRQTDGFNTAPQGDENDGNSITTFLMKGGVRIFEGLTLDGVVRRTTKAGERDDEDLSLAPGIPVPQFDSPSNFTSEIWLIGVDAKLELLGGKWVHTLHADRNETRNTDLLASPFFAPSEFFEDYTAETEKLRYANTYRLDTPELGHVRHFITGLVEQTDESFRVTSADDVPRERRQIGYAGEIKGEYWESLFLSASLRHDDNDAFDDFTTWRTAGSWRVLETPLRLHASYGTGVKYPALFEQFGRFPPFFVPNPLLKPEEAEGWDAGIELSFLDRRFVVDATYFESDLENKIRSKFPSMINLPGISTREGWELSGTAQIMEGLTLSANYTRLSAKDSTGLDEIRRPENSGRVDLSYTFNGGRGNVTLSALYNGSVIDEPIDVFFSPIRVTLDDYWVVNAAASYEIAKGVELFGRIENMFDEDYQEVFGFETAGAAAYAGVRFKLVEEQTRPWSEGR